MPSPPPAPRSSPRPQRGAGPGTVSPATARCWPRGTEQRLCGARGRTGHRPTQSRSTREGATALRLGGFCDFLKDMYSSSPEGPSSAVGSAHGGEARRRAALLNSKCPRPCGRGARSPPAEKTFWARGAALLVGMVLAPRHGHQHGQATARERTSLGCSLQPAGRGPPGKPVIVHGTANRAHSPRPGEHGDPSAAPQDAGIRCW